MLGRTGGRRLAHTESLVASALPLALICSSSATKRYGSIIKHRAAGALPGGSVVRISVGCEDFDDLRQDLVSSLSRL